MTGRFAYSKAGHDKGALYVVVGCEGDFVYLCDGRLKLIAAPKKKRLKHIQPVNRLVADELLNRLTTGQTVRDEEIKYAIKQYNEQSEIK